MPAMDMGHNVLWMVDRAHDPQGSEHQMMPVSHVDREQVWYAMDFSRRLVFDNRIQAAEFKKRIINQYGVDEVVAVVADDPQWADQRARDQHLPHSAWIAKYGSQT